MEGVEQQVAQRLDAIGRQVEDHVDQELAKLESLKVDDLQSIRDEMQRKRKARVEMEKTWRDLVTIKNMNIYFQFLYKVNISVGSL